MWCNGYKALTGRWSVNRDALRAKSAILWSTKYVHTNPFSYTSVFYPTETDTNIRVHTSVFESFSNVHTSYEKTIRFRSPWETDYRVHDVSVFENLRFRRFRPSTLIRKASVFESRHLGRRFRKLPFSWVKVSVFHRISVDDRRKRMPKVCVFKRKRLETSIKYLRNIS